MSLLYSFVIFMLSPIKLVIASVALLYDSMFHFMYNLHLINNILHGGFKIVHGAKEQTSLASFGKGALHIPNSRKAVTSRRTHNEGCQGD